MPTQKREFTGQLSQKSLAYPSVAYNLSRRQNYAGITTPFERPTKNWYVFAISPSTSQSRPHSYPNQNPESRTSLPGIAFGDFARRFRAPTLDEGFDDIIPVEFQFHGSEEAKGLWGQYWV
jgi:hypothetical protein